MKMKKKVAVVIPCFKVKKHIESVIRSIGSEVYRIYVIDDACPEKTGDFVEKNIKNKKIRVIRHETNQGVGGAVITGYKRAVHDGCDVIVKLDGDGQMDPGLLPLFIKPILTGKADYTKGNRFYNIEFLSRMPVVRILGNSALSLINKLVSGYWDIMDPTNGYTAIHSSIINVLPLHKIEKRYFFESDMLFRLGTIRAVVQDIPMNSVYQDEESNLNVKRVLMEFPGKYLKRFLKRIFYLYFLRDFNAGTVEFLSGIFLLTIGGVFGIYKWAEASDLGIAATSGTVMLSAFPLLVGAQLLISSINYDIQSVPGDPIQSKVSLEL